MNARFLLPLALLALPSARAQTKPDDNGMIAMLEATRARIDLEAAGTPAFHLHASFSTFDLAGAPDGEGSLEEWSDGGKNIKRTVTYRGSTWTTIRGATTYSSPAPVTVSGVELLTIRGLFNPVPSRPDPFRVGLSYNTVAMGTHPLGCVTIESPKPDPDRKFVPEDRSRTTREQAITPPRLLTTYCILPEDGTLRISELPPDLSLTYGKLVPFSNKMIAREITLSQHKVLRAKLSVGTLEAWQPTDSFFAPEPGMLDHPALVQVGEANMREHRMSNVPAVYPSAAKDLHEDGKVMLSVLIGPDGVVQSTEVVSASNTRFIAPVQAAVMQWKYEPYEVHGIAVPVQTFVNYTFRMGNGGSGAIIHH